MGVKMVREPSDTPNINNIDDFIGLRYSYGNQNGYVKDKGSEIGYEINGSIFKIKSGRIVLQGVECDVDANGVEILIDSIANKRYHVVYLQVSLANMSAQILEQHDTASYPSISAGDDFNAVTTGTGRVILYKFTSTNGNISDVSKVLQEIVYSGRALDGYDIEKGTVEQRLIDVDERLTNLGFKSGNFIFSGGTVTTNTITRQGNYVIGTIDLTNANIVGERHETYLEPFHQLAYYWTFEIPISSNDFYSENLVRLISENLTCGYYYTVNSSEDTRFSGLGGYATIKNNKLIITTNSQVRQAGITYKDGSLLSIRTNFGYEANPL